MHLSSSSREIKQLESKFKKLNEPVVVTMMPVGHCINHENCGPRDVAFYHTACLKYRCPDYKPRHTKNAKILENIKSKT
jgi:hypothetical protein